MSLIEYIQTRGGTAKLSCVVVAQVATEADCTPATIYMIALGHRTAGPKLATRIEAATDGEVTRNELRPDVFGDS